MSTQRELSLRVGVQLGNTQQKLQALQNNIKLATAEFKNASVGIEGFEDTTEGLRKKLSLLNTSYQQSAKKVDILKEAITQAKKTLEQSNNAYTQQKNKVQDLEKTLEQAKKEYGETSKEVKELEKELEKENRSLKQNENALRSADNNLVKLQTDLNKAEKEAKEFANAMDETNESLSNMGDKSPFGEMLGDLKEMGAGFDRLKGKISTVVEVVARLGKAFVSLGVNSIKWLGNIISKIVTMSAKIGGAIAGFSGFAIKVAGDFQAMDEMFNATFKGFEDQASKSMKNVADSTGIYVGRLKQPFAQFFSQLKGSGVESAEALAQTERGMKLVADASAYYNMPMEEASELLRSFIRGNTEAGDRIGLFTSETQRNTESMKKYNKKWQDLTEAQKQMLMLDISEEIYEQSGALEQALREADGLENVLGNLKFVAIEFIGAMGKNMLEPAIDGMKDFGQILLDTKKILEKQGLAKAVEFMVNEIVNKLSSMADSIPSVMSTVINSMISFINNSLPNIMALGSKIVQNIADGIASNQQAIANGIANVIEQMANFINTNMPAIMQAGKNILDALKQGLENNMPAIKEAVYNITRTAVDLFLEYKGMIIEAGLQVGGAFIKGVWEGIWNAGASYKPQNDNFFVPTAEEGRVQGAEYGTAWVTSSGEVLKNSPSFFDAMFSKDTYTQVEVSGQDTGYALINGVRTKISELSPEIKNVVQDMLKTEEKAIEEGKKTGKATADGVKQGVYESKEQVKNATKEVGTESSKALLDSMQNLTPETYNKMLDVAQKIRQSATDMYNGAKYSFSQLGKASKEAMTDMYKGVGTSMFKTSQKVKQEASSLYNGAKTSFVNLANVGKNQFSNLYKNVTSYTDRMRREVMSDWSKMANYVANRKITGTVTIRRNTINSVQQAQANARAIPNVVLSGQYYNARTRDSRSVNESIALNGNPSSVSSTDDSKVTEMKTMNALLVQMLEVLTEGKVIQIDNSIEVSGKQIAKQTCQYMEKELNSMKRKQNRLIGQY